MAGKTQKKHMSLRVAAPVSEQLEELARRRGLSKSELAERYIAEGLSQDEFPQIYFREGALGRRAALVGTRLDVWQILETVRNHDNSVEEAAAYLGQSVERIRAAVRYAGVHKEEIEAFAERETAEAVRAETIWRAEQNLLSS
jgi:uncharacterized protein (DUF433 family)